MDFVIIKRLKSRLVIDLYDEPVAKSVKSPLTPQSGYLSDDKYAQLSIEEKMDDVAKQTLVKVQLKNKNPFSKVKYLLFKNLVVGQKWTWMLSVTV